MTLLVDFLLLTNEVDNTLHVAHEIEFVLERECGSLRDNPFKSVSHDSYEHVEEGDLRDERRGNEYKVAEDQVCMVLEAVHVELTEHQQVLVEC